MVADIIVHTFHANPGVNHDRKIRRLADYAFMKAFVRDGLPVYLETAMDRNRAVYERYGFETYHFWEDREKNIRFWFMKLEPGKNKHQGRN